ncbi:C2H2-type zinc finger transcription factor [Mucor lusitanicus CBS 277.49]|uniref:C2H2-type zinc finger transcription factor n=1 Tax=Mucor lusitanicus CBS 277.49 TaxID=747725 RepID=A0A168MQR9_MUCCL|nr:C2H2-type zinc finger transcription factor [Mucor lusitanicus CBS 277.49]
MGFNDWSDDENASRNHGRDRFRHERSLERERYGEEYERYDRKKRGRRSPTPPEDRRHKRRPSYSPPPMRSYRNNRDIRNDPETDHYIPNYERDGYVPGPRYGSKPDLPAPMPFANSNPAVGAPGAGNGYPMMGDMMNAPMVNQGWAGSVDRLGRFTPVDPAQLDYLVPFKHFFEFTRRTSARRIDDEDMQKRFAQYKEKFAVRLLAQFFAANKDKEWFQDKYHPTISVPRLEDIKVRRRRYLKEFLEELERGDYDRVNYDKDGPTTTQNDDDEPAEAAASAEFNDDDAANAEYETRLVIKTVPPTIAREKIMEMCNKIEGFDYLSLSEPGPNKKFHRIGWINFKQGTDMKKVFELMDNQKVDDFVFHLAMNRKNMTQTRSPRIAPDVTNTTERLQKDLEQAKEVALALESLLGEDTQEGLKAVELRAQKVISEHKPEEAKGATAAAAGESEDGKVEEEESVDRWNLKKSLDMTIAYLRRVHMYCYYCALECDSAEELSRKCCDPHCRTITSAAAATDEAVDPKQAAKTERGVAQWVKNLDQKIALKIHTPDDRELKRLGGRVLQTEIDDYVKAHVLKEHESKYKCQVGECSKAFKGFDYVEKHILSKHPEEIERIKAEVEYYNNYVCDPNHIIPSTVNHNNNNNTQMMPMNMPFAGGQQPFMMPHQNMRMSGLPAAVPGTPWDQIPRIGFGSSENPAGWANAARRPRPTPASAAMMDLEESLLPKDPRQVKSYVDLDAPAEGDSNISFY